MAYFDLAELCDDRTYSVCYDECGPLTYEVLDKLHSRLQSRMSIERDYWLYYSLYNSWDYGKSESEKIMEPKFKVGDRVRIINNSTDVGGHTLGTTGVIISFQYYIDRNDCWKIVCDKTGNEYYNAECELELIKPITTQIIPSDNYINQIALDLAKIK